MTFITLGDLNGYIGVLIAFATLVLLLRERSKKD